jgi:hypothetical protein
MLGRQQHKKLGCSSIIKREAENERDTKKRLTEEERNTKRKAKIEDYKKDIKLSKEKFR